MEFEGDGPEEEELGEGRDQSLRWSPEVARRSVRGLLEGGSQRTRVIG